ncbi:hypothetical protein [Streptomyces acidiscabies]|uniref:hypothetical protein n=1 Tax=Streptomyces acidiscabies TaxID=42234 RepID=UPI003986942D
MLGEEEGRAHVDGDGLVERLDAGVLDLAARGDAGVVDEDVEAGAVGVFQSAPRRSAIARPMPRLPPVTSAVFTVISRTAPRSARSRA